MRYLERNRILFAAARAYNHWMFLRMAGVFVLMLVATVGINFLSYLGLSDWSGTVVAVFFGALFYALLLWELNGPLGKAVAKYLSSDEYHAPTV